MKQKKSGFQFKQFFVGHGQCAMKVGTDSIMLGSWIEPLQAKNILDIGTGSGVLALMLAQKTTDDCTIYGIDIDPEATQQAHINGQNSPWKNRVSFANTALQQLQHSHVLPQSFDLIMSNPPYFTENIKTNVQNEDKKREQARQSTTLSHLELLHYVDLHLVQTGYFYCVLPADSSAAFISQASQKNLFLTEQLHVKSTKNARIIRHILKFSRYSSQVHCDDITIYTQPSQYSSQYIELCSAYYLRF